MSDNICKVVWIMPIQYKKSHFMGLKSKCPYITIYDEDDVNEIIHNLINTNEMAASIGDFKYLPIFPKLKMLTILCGEFFQEGLGNLYRHKQLEALCFDNNYVSSENDAEGVLDLNEFPSMRSLFTWEYNVMNLPYAKSLQTLGIETVNTDLSYISSLSNLDSLAAGGKKLQSLSGIENMKLQCVHIEASKKLTDISSLEASKDTLRFLRIEYCPNIKDFSVLSKLKKLKSLSICGYNGIFVDLDFINELPELEFFVTDYNVLDGNINPLTRLPYASILQNRRHYNQKDDDLKKEQKVTLGNEVIPVWRRICI